MTVMVDGASIRATALGVLVSRATAALPQTTSEALFTITGGRIVVVSIVGEVTTVIETQANNTNLVFNPSASGTDKNMCAVKNITALPVGELLSITGVTTDALESERGITNGMLQDPITLAEGAIELSCAASNTGAIGWDLIYVPLDDGATVAAA